MWDFALNYEEFAVFLIVTDPKTITFLLDSATALWSFF